MEAIDEIRAKSIRANLKLIECPIRHLGTEEGYKIYARLQKHLEENRVEIRFMTMVQNILMEKGRAVGVVTEKGETFYAAEIVAGVGREGSEWFSHICKEHGIETQNGTVDVGVRVEVRDEIMKELNEKLYEAKLVYYTPTFDDKVRGILHKSIGGSGDRILRGRSGGSQWTCLQIQGKKDEEYELCPAGVQEFHRAV